LYKPFDVFANIIMVQIFDPFYIGFADTCSFLYILYFSFSSLTSHKRKHFFRVFFFCHPNGGVMEGLSGTCLKGGPASFSSERGRSTSLKIASERSKFHYRKETKRKKKKEKML